MVVTPRSSRHLASGWVQPMGGTSKGTVGDTGHVSPFFTCISSSSDVPSVVPILAVRDHCGTNLIRLTSVPEISEHHNLLLPLLPHDGCGLLVLILRLPHCSLFGF